MSNDTFLQFLIGLETNIGSKVSGGYGICVIHFTKMAYSKLEPFRIREVLADGTWPPFGLLMFHISCSRNSN